MDRDELSEAITQELGEILAVERRAAGPELLETDLDGMEARLQAVSRRVCGATLERVLAVRAVLRGERPPCPVYGGRAAAAGGAGMGAGPTGADRRRDTGPADLCLHAGGLRAGA